jgi:energy-converting hydrogenase Eha subunit H
MNLSIFAYLIAIPLLSSPLVYLVGRLGSHKLVLFGGRGWLVRALALIAALAAWWPFFLLWQDFAVRGERLLFNMESIWLQADGLSFLLAAMVLTLGTLAIAFSGKYMAGEVGEEKYYAMLLAMMGLMLGLGCAKDLFNMWVWFEAMAVSSYLLVAFYREQPGSLEAGMKYVIQSAVGSVLALLGIALVLGQTGTLDMDSIRQTITYSPTLLAAGALFFVGFGVKVAIVPMHTWLPDAHSQAPSAISAMLSGVVIEAGLVTMLRALGVLTGTAETWGMLLLAFGALNILYGNLLALRQSQLKRLLAYSSLITDERGDLEAKFVVRLKELLVSCFTIRTIVDNLPAGELATRFPRRVPAGETISRVEAPRGEAFYFIKSNGTESPARIKIRTPSLCNWTSVINKSIGHQLADVPMLISGMDPCFSCNDRMVTIKSNNNSQTMSWADLREYGIKKYGGRW